ncbi:MAG TPA: hypothetical protein VMA75_04820 [Candidatus Paceibacterota bacterium]|nr:hypothetical protein [Candidatus Paceibacterota bacterium]
MDAPLRYRVFAGILIFFSFLVITAKTIDPDLYWHLRDGELILATHTVPRVDTYSYTMAGMPWVDHEWLVEAAFAWMYNHGLMPVLDLIFAIIAFIPFVVWLRRYRTWPDLWAIGAGASVFMSFLAVKPQIVSYLFFFIVYELLAHYYLTAKDARGAHRKIYLLALPLVFFVWANIHAEFVSGLLLFGVFPMTDAAVAIYRKTKGQWNAVLFPAAMFVLSAVTPLFNPYGAGLYGEIVRVALSANTMKYIQEWQSPFAGSPSLSPTTFALAFVLSIFIFLVLRFGKRVPPAALSAAVIFFLLFAKAQRMGPLFIIIAIPFMHEGLSLAATEVVSRWHLASRRAKKIFRGVGNTLSVAAFGAIVVTPATLVPSQYPVGAVTLLNDQAAQGNHIVLLNFYGWGGYLDWNAPEIPVFIDGRMPHWTEPDGTSAMQNYVDIFLAPTNWPTQETILKEWGVNTVLIQSSKQGESNANTTLTGELLANGWAETYKDQTAIVLEAPDQN